MPPVQQTEGENVEPTQDQLDYDREQLDNPNPANDADADAVAEATAAREASAKGWVPKDKYTGDPEKWVDARTFVDRGKKFNHNLQNKVSKLEGEIAKMASSAAQFKKYHEEQLQQKDAELVQAIKTLKSQRNAAVRDDDDEGASAIEDRMEVLEAERRKTAEELEKSKQPEPEPDGPAGSKETIQSWIDDGNKWFAEDLKLQTYAVQLARELTANGEKARGRELLDMVTAQMREEFPNKFGNQRRNRPGNVEGGGNTPVNAGGKGERDLPAADRAIMNELLEGGYVTKENFLKNYRW